ncbi:serine hydrolase domain-containing protein [Joostella sp. CR20]|uniref:serine hydrolase domain-containing protein n=1 Tax=Joostella sp. CR20 TaxID=2804312 RepID=UPI00313D8916
MKFFSKIILNTITVIILLIAIGCKNKIEKPLESKNTFVNDVALDSFFSILHKNKMFNGAVAVKKDGKLIFKKGYGIANFSQKTPFLPSTSIEVASVSKQFTAAAIQILAQQNKLNINEFAYKYLGDAFPYHNITIQHLLTHTSGLKDYEDYFKIAWDSTLIASNKDILNYFITQKPVLESVPGEKYHYSNSGYVLLASIVEAVSNISLDVFLEKYVFTKATMNQSYFLERDSIWNAKNYAPGYMLNPTNCNYDNPELLNGKQYYRFLSGRLGSGRLSSSVNDLIKWDSILYTDNFLNEASKKIAFTPQPPSHDTSDYGYGWHIPDTSAQNKTVYHTGSWAGNKTYIKRYLNNKSLIVILNNTNSPYMVAIRKEIDNYIENGTPLNIPQRYGEEVLEQEICTLTEENLSNWLTTNKDVKWNKKSLLKLHEFYIEHQEVEKATIAHSIIENLKL